MQNFMHIIRVLSPASKLETNKCFPRLGKAWSDRGQGEICLTRVCPWLSKARGLLGECALVWSPETWGCVQSPNLNSDSTADWLQSFGQFHSLVQTCFLICKMRASWKWTQSDVTGDCDHCHNQFGEQFGHIQQNWTCILTQAPAIRHRDVYPWESLVCAKILQQQLQ